MSVAYSPGQGYIKLLRLTTHGELPPSCANAITYAPLLSGATAALMRAPSFANTTRSPARMRTSGAPRGIVI
jgi:hypothetical protein